MKKPTILLIFAALAIQALSQNDTTNLTAEDKLFKGSYEVKDEPSVSPVLAWMRSYPRDNGICMYPSCLNIRRN